MNASNLDKVSNGTALHMTLPLVHLFNLPLSLSGDTLNCDRETAPQCFRLLDDGADGSGQAVCVFDLKQTHTTPGHNPFICHSAA